MTDKPEVIVEPQPTPQPDPVIPAKEEENKGTENQPVPYSRFSEKNTENKANALRADNAEKELVKMRLERKTEEEKTLTEQEKFKELSETRGTENEKLTKQLDVLQTEAKTRWEGIFKTIPEDKQEFFAVGESNEDVAANLTKYAEFVRAGVFGTESLSEVDNSGGTRDKPANNKFGGYGSMIEWADENPKTFGENREKKNSLDRKIGVHTVIS